MGGWGEVEDSLKTQLIFHFFRLMLIDQEAGGDVCGCEWVEDVKGISYVLSQLFFAQ